MLGKRLDDAMVAGMTRIALYDLDRTITRRPTYLPFLLHAAWRLDKKRLLFLPVLVIVSIGYVFGLVSRARLKEVNQHLLLGHAIPAARLVEIGESFADKTLHENIHAQAFATIAADKAEGRRLAMASASYSFYVVPLARRLGFDDVIATGSMRGEDGEILARIDGENCYSTGKLGLIRAWMEQQQIDPEQDDIRFYSDSESDMPVFEIAHEPVATNPTSKLRKIAEKAGWRVIAWG